ncbi:MAG: hypothetical protein PF689_05445 [Deltaproteobacteria bacterium]|jgi:hypothetical protein|nr:hypothetical protein [Deltaproteobacteria bacterium]
MDTAKLMHRPLEALVVLALQKYLPSSRIFWQPARSPVPLDADIITGPSPQKPEMVVLVTHTYAQNAAQTKNWRDLHEFFLYKQKFPATKTIRIKYGPEISRRWPQATAKFFDANLQINDLGQNTGFEKFIHTFVQSSERLESQQKILQRLQKQLEQPELARVFKYICQQFEDSLNSPGLFLFNNKVFSGSRAKIHKPFFPTALKRAVILSAIYPEILHPPTQKKLDKNNLQGIARETIWGLEWKNPYKYWIESSSNLLGKSTLEKFQLRAAPFLAGQRKRVENLDLFYTLFLETSRKLQNSSRPLEFLADRIETLAANAQNTGGNPLLLGLRYFAKQHGSEKFGHSQLLRQAGIKATTGNLYKVSRLFAGTEAIFSPKLLRIIAQKILECGEKQISQLQFKERATYLIFYDEAVKNRKIEPLKWLLLEKYPHLILKSRFPTLVDPEGKVGTIRILQNPDNSDIYHWKTAHRGHRDKTKELAAKGTALAALYPPPVRCYLYLDGDFSASDLHNLANSGWSELIPLSALQNKL